MSELLFQAMRVDDKKFSAGDSCFRKPRTQPAMLEIEREGAEDQTFSFTFVSSLPNIAHNL